MKILSWAKRLFSSSDPPPPFGTAAGAWGNGWGSSTSAGTSVSETTTLSIPAFFRAIDNLCSHIAMLPCPVMERIGKNRESMPTHPVHALLNIEANPEMTAFDASRAVWMQRLLYGNGRFEIERTNGREPLALWPMPVTAKMCRVPEKTGPLYHKWYDDSGEHRIPDADVLHLKGLSADGLWGLGLVRKIARENIGVAMALQEYASAYFGNQAMVGTIFVGPPGMQKPQLEENLKRIREVHEGPKKSWRSMVLSGGGWEVKKAGGENRNAQMIETMTLSLQDAARWLNMPPPLLMDYSRSTFSNIKEIDQWYVKYTLNPHFRQFEQEANRKLFKMADRGRLSIKFNPDALLRGDAETQANVFSQGISSGRFSINRILELMDENGIGPAGDVHYVPVNLTTAERMMEGDVGGGPQDEPPNDEPDAPKQLPREEPDPDDDEPDNREMVLRAFSRSFAVEGERLAARWQKTPTHKRKDEKFIADTTRIVSESLTEHVTAAMELIHGDLPLGAERLKLARDIAEFSVRVPVLKLMANEIEPSDVSSELVRQVGERLGV